MRVSYLMLLPYRPLGLAALATCVFSAPVADRPAFQPEAGSSVSKTFEYGVDFALDEFIALVDGQDVAAMLGSFELSVEVQNTIAVTDTYVAPGDGRPAKLKRAFDSLEGLTNVALTTDFGGEDQEMPSSSDLEGTSVIFTWDEEAEDYKASFEDEDGDADLLAGLVEDMDLRALLPPGEVSPDDTWEVDLERLGVIALPGGNVKLLPEDVDQESFGDTDVFDGLMDEDYGAYLTDLLEGTCECTYKGETEEGLGEILVSIEIGSAADLSDMLTQVLETVGDSVGEAPPMTIELADLNLDLEGEGVLLWDLEQGRLASFEFIAEVIVAADLGVSVDLDGDSQSAEVSFEFSGDYTYRVETEE